MVRDNIKQILLTRFTPSEQTLKSIALKLNKISTLTILQKLLQDALLAESIAVFETNVDQFLTTDKPPRLNKVCIRSDPIYAKTNRHPNHPHLWRRANVIGQACEFDYSGVQACKALKAEGYRVVLVNSNPATIMTDPEFADATYVEPLTVQTVEMILQAEASRRDLAHGWRPDGAESGRSRS